jgi:transposase
MQLSADAIWLATAAVDMRTGIDGLSLHVQQALGRPPCDGTAYVFANRRRTRLKLVCWDGTGVWMCLRRLHRGQFIWPQVDDACWQMSAEQWQWLVTGVDWQRLCAPAPAQWRL